MTGHDHESDEDKAESLEMAVLKEDPQRCSRLGRSPHLSVPRPIILLQWKAKLKISLRKVNVMTYFHLHMHEKQINLGMRFGTTTGCHHRFIIQAAKRYAPLFLPERRWIIG